MKWGVLLVNSGTPASLATRDVRAFLAGLLGDPRVVELPRFLWWPILHGIILRVRPRASAKKYAAIWTAAGSPLAVYSEALRVYVMRLTDEEITASWNAVLDEVGREPDEFVREAGRRVLEKVEWK